MKFVNVFSPRTQCDAEDLVGIVWKWERGGEEEGEWGLEEEEEEEGHAVQFIPPHFILGGGDFHQLPLLYRQSTQSNTQTTLRATSSEAVPVCATKRSLTKKQQLAASINPNAHHLPLHPSSS